MTYVLEKPHQKMLLGLEAKIYTAARLIVSIGSDNLMDECYGTLGAKGPKVQDNTLFDLASLTKIHATTVLFMRLVKKKPDLLDWDLTEWFDVPHDKRKITPKMLLTHSSGLPHWRPYYLIAHKFASLEDLRDKILAEPLVFSPGNGILYSDLGFMLLMLVLEKEKQQPLNDILHDEILEPLELTSKLMFSPACDNIAATRNGDVPGLVNDLNARSIKGMSGHAGLFGTGCGVHRVLQEIQNCLIGRRGLFSPMVVSEFIAPADLPGNTTRALGFNTPSELDASCGHYFSKKSYGHTGFTGTSFWVDPEKDLIVTLLTNRVIMGESDLRIQDFRPELHDVIFESVFGLNAGR